MARTQTAARTSTDRAPTVRAPTAASARRAVRAEPLDVVDVDVGGIDELAAAIRTLRTTDEVTRFLRDLCTRAELEALAHRWETARLVDDGVPYLEIAERVPTSTATVTRVAQWVRHGVGGYRIALERAKRR
jgi:TrpR-related protein YerC/YecD